MIAVDSSVVIAAFATWHDGHESALGALQQSPRLPSHAAFETFSVLTRLPPPHRAPADLVSAFIDSRFPEPFLILSDSACRGLIRSAPDLEIVGGAIYDAVIAATAREHDAMLLSRDRRAASTYERLGVDYEVLP